MNIVVVTKNKKMSLHTSFKKACVCYGWPYDQIIRKGMPNEYAGHKIKKMPTDFTVHEIRLMQLITGECKYTHNFSGDFDSSSEHVDFYLNNEEYQIRILYHLESEWETGGSDENGREETYKTGEATPSHLVEVLDPEGDIVTGSISDEVYERLTEYLTIY